jgi:hypothetical protein
VKFHWIKEICEVPLREQGVPRPKKFKKRWFRWIIVFEIVGRTNRLLYLIRYVPHTKRRFQQFFYCWFCICCSGNDFTDPLLRNDMGIFTEPLSSNGRGIHIETHRLMGGIYEVRRWVGLRYHDKYICVCVRACVRARARAGARTKFRKDLSSHSKVDGGDTHTHTDCIEIA